LQTGATLAFFLFKGCLNGLVHTPDAVAAGSASNVNYLEEMGHADISLVCLKRILLLRLSSTKNP
jgi:hypothetical protein